MKKKICFGFAALLLLSNTAWGQVTAPKLSGVQVTNKVKLTWTPATSAAGIKAYMVFKNGLTIGQTNATTLTFTDNAPLATNKYHLWVFDKNRKYAQSNTAIVNVFVACAESPPSVNLTAPWGNSSPVNRVGLYFQASVKNNDPGTCISALFNLKVIAPAGWIKPTFSPFPIKPGQTATFGVGITPPLGTPPGTYPIYFETSGTPAHTVSAMMPYTVLP